MKNYASNKGTGCGLANPEYQSNSKVLNKGRATKIRLRGKKSNELRITAHLSGRVESDISALVPLACHLLSDQFTLWIPISGLNTVLYVRSADVRKKGLQNFGVPGKYC